jgi:hypothetical protein
LPKAAQERVEWQTAAEMLILAAQGQRPVMFAEIAMRQALHAGKTVPTPQRKQAANIESCANLCCPEPMCVRRR